MARRRGFTLIELPVVRKRRGFTLIELLVVIAIIAMLATIVIVSYSGAQKKAGIAKATADMNEIVNAAVIAREEQNTRLGYSNVDGKPGITGSSCSSCPGQQGLAEGLRKIQEATGGVVTGLVNISTDPWGNKYHLDENEDEVAGYECTNDYVASFGPDGIDNGIAYSADQGKIVAATGSDDIVVNIPIFKTKTAAVCPNSY